MSGRTSMNRQAKVTLSHYDHGMTITNRPQMQGIATFQPALLEIRHEFRLHDTCCTFTSTQLPWTMTQHPSQCFLSNVERSRVTLYYNCGYVLATSKSILSSGCSSIAWDVKVCRLEASLQRDRVMWVRDSSLVQMKQARRCGYSSLDWKDLLHGGWRFFCMEKLQRSTTLWATATASN